MVSNETWMGSGTYVTLAPESELFLGYMPYGPTLGRSGTDKAHLIKYSLGYGVDGENVILEANHGETFTDATCDLSTAAGSGSSFGANPKIIQCDSTTNIKAGMTVTHNDVPTGSKVTQVDSSTLFRIDNDVTGSATNATLTFSQNAHFTDYYHLVPDLYTGCIAKFYVEKTASGTTYDLLYTAIVAGNDADAIYFHGNLADFDTLHNPVDTAISDDWPRGYIVLESHGSTIPAPVALENRATVTNTGPHDEYIVCAAGAVDEYLEAGDLIYESGGSLLGELWSATASTATVNSRSNATTSSTHLHFISSDIGRADAAGTLSNGRITLAVDDGSDDLDVSGIFTAGDYISNYSSDSEASATIVGKIITMSADGETLTISQSASGAVADNDYLYWGRDLPSATGTSIHTVKPRVLSDNWVGLSNTITTPSVDIETKQINLALGGSRNYSYQYKGLETAGNASLDLNLNHGTWLYYALGSLATSATATATTDITNVFSASTGNYDNTGTFSATNASVWAGYDKLDSSSGSQNGKFHRVPNGTSTLCPPVLPGNGASPLTNDPSVSNGVGSDLITYTFSEANGSKLPTFGLELSQQKGTALAAEPMVDRRAYNETVYAQLYPGCMVNSMTISANENEECKTSLDLNVKRAFECPTGYVARMYDETNNDTNEFKNLFNFGQITGRHNDIVQDFITPFYFSDGTISLFGAEFMKVQSFNLSITNTVTDKRYVGQYNKQIKMAVPTQRTYEITMSAQVTDRRIFDELRRESPHRLDLGQATDGSNANIQLLLTKDTGERIKLQFDDYMVSASTWPIVEDRGPIYVDFTIMPLRTNTTDAVSHWVMQS